MDEIKDGLECEVSRLDDRIDNDVRRLDDKLSNEVRRLDGRIDEQNKLTPIIHKANAAAKSAHKRQDEHLRREHKMRVEERGVDDEV